MVQSFREFLSASRIADAQIQEVLKQLYNLHSVFTTHPIIKAAVEDKRSVTSADLIKIKQDALAYQVKIAPKPPETVTERDIQRLSEMIALQSALSLLESVIGAKSKAQGSDFTESYKINTQRENDE